MIRNKSERVVFRKSVAFGVSMLALTIAAPAYADCAPPPTQPGDVVTCTGDDSDGILVDVSATVNVEEGASVSQVQATTVSQAGQFFPRNFVSLNVGGTVHSVVVESGSLAPGATFSPSTQMIINVLETGVIDQLGIQLRTTPGSENGPFNFFRSASAEVINRGLITSNGGTALFATEAGFVGFNSISNLSTGTIRGIFAPFGNLSNQGLIEGAGTSAIVALGGNFPVSASGNIFNSGVIQNDGPASTIEWRMAANGGFSDLNNSGLIRNLGSGYAITSDSGLFLLNEQTGEISTNGIAAIATAGQLTLDNYGVITGGQYAILNNGSLGLLNRGVINGDIRVSGLDKDGNVPVTTIDNSHGGIINGSVLLDDGDDQLITDFGTATNPFAGISGTVDAGGGFNTWIAHFTQDTTLSTAFAMPNSFQSIGFSIEHGATLELSEGFIPSGTIHISDTALDFGGDVATLLTTGTLEFDGVAIDITSSVRTAYSFINRGSILARLGPDDGFAVDIGASTYPINSGTIRAIGGGGVRYFGNAPFENSGSIIADGTGFYGFGGLLNNSGLIRSTNDVGARLLASTGEVSTNSGTIEGQIAGVALNAELINSGSIRSAGIGVAFDLGGTIRNTRSGIISGETLAIGASDLFGFVSGATVINEGRIDGNVDLAGFPGSDEPTNNMFIALSGSRLNGNLHLGSGNDMLVTTLGNENSNRLAGISGQVTGTGNQSLRYLVDTNRKARIGNFGLFSTIGFDLANDANVNVTWTGPSNTVFEFAGVGRADISANLTGDASNWLINTSVASVRNFIDPTSFIENNIALTSRGNLTIIHDDPNRPPALGIVVGAGSFTNEGIILARDLAPYPFGQPFTAIYGFGDVINNGLIRIGGGLAIDAVNFGTVITNNGRIEQVAGDGAADGVRLFAGRFVNTGRVNVAGSAVLLGSEFQFSQSVVENSGTLESTLGVAITADGFGDMQILNRAGGRIVGATGFEAMILAPGTTVNNAGSIVGDVDASRSSFPFFEQLLGSTYISNGGSLTGNLNFGLGSDAFIYKGGSISGIVDAEDGFDVLNIFAEFSGDRFDLARYRNFESIGLFGRGRITLRNVPTLSSLQVDGADFAIAAGQTITATQSFSQVAGRTRIDGTLITDRADLTGGILSGSGVFDPNDAYLANTFLVPGDNGRLGTLTVQGDIYADSTTSFIFDVGRTSSDRLVVVGDADRSGIAGFNGALLLNPVSGGPRAGVDYRIITATGGIVGQFSSVQGKIGVLTPTLTYGPDAVTLRYQAGSLAAQLPSNATSVQIAFANALDGLRGSSYNNLASLYGMVDVMSSESLNLTLGALNPTIASEATSQLRNDKSTMINSLSARAARLGGDMAPRGSWSVSGTPLAAGTFASGQQVSSYDAVKMRLSNSDAVANVIAGILPEHMSGFIDIGFNEAGTVYGNTNLGEQGGRRNWHMAMGLEMDAAEDLTLGAAVSISKGKSRILGGNSQVETSQAAVYGKLALGSRGYMTALGSMATSRIGVQRSSFDEFGLLQLGGRGTAFSIDTQMEAGYAFTVAKSISLSPHVSLLYSSFNLDNLQEQGGVSALHLSDIGENRVEARAGARLEGRTSLGKGWSFAPQLQAGWVRTLMNGNGMTTVRFTAADTLAFAIPFGSTDRSWGEMQGGIQFSNRNLTFGASLKTAIGRTDLKDNRASAEVQFRF